MDYAAIALEIAKPAYAGLSDAEVAQALMGLTVQQPNVDVPIAEIVGYLAITGKLSGLKRYVAAGAGNADALAAADDLLIVVRTPGLSVMRTSDPAIFAALKAQLETLAGDAASGIAAADVAALLAYPVSPSVPAFGRDPVAIIDAAVVHRARLGDHVSSPDPVEDPAP